MAMEWEVRSERPGTWDLRADRRPVKYDYGSLDEALADAKRRGATEVVVVEDDGYRSVHRLVASPPPPPPPRTTDGYENPYSGNNPYLG